jgi:hypothetical protein
VNKGNNDSPHKSEDFARVWVSVRACVCEFQDEVLSFPARCADAVPAYRGALLEQLHRPTFCFVTLLGQPLTQSPSVHNIPMHHRQMAHKFHSHYYISIFPNPCPCIQYRREGRPGVGVGGDAGAPKGGPGPDYVAIVSVFLSSNIFRMHKLIPSDKAQVPLQLTVSDLL